MRPKARILLPWLVPAALLILWQLSAQVGWLSSRVLPALTDVVGAGYTLGLSGKLWENILISALRAATGFAIGGTIGFVLGLLNGLSGIGERLLDSTLQMVRNVPHLALIPLVILWFGIDEEAKLFLVALGVFFPIYLNTFHGIRNVDRQLIEMGRSYGMSQTELVWRIVLPGALPSILVGVRFSLGIMWLTLIVAETIAGGAGIGHMAMEAREFMRTDIVVLSIIIYALFGKLADSLARGLERLWLSWSPAYARQ